jgi:steroid 5-alpha reductase family enzyme
MNAWLLTGAGLNISAGLMLLAWFIAKRLKNAGLLEIARPISLIILAAFFAGWGDGSVERRLTLLILVTVSSAAYAGQALRIIRCLLPQELPAYAGLRSKFPQRPWLMFFGYFQIQGLMTGLLAIPLAIISSNDLKGIAAFEIAGIVLWFLGTVLYLKRGLLRVSASEAGLRVPFPWLTWLGYCLMALAAPGGLWGIISLVLIGLLLK